MTGAKFRQEKRMILVSSMCLAKPVFVLLVLVGIAVQENPPPLPFPL